MTTMTPKPPVRLKLWRVPIELRGELVVIAADELRAIELVRANGREAVKTVQDALDFDVHRATEITTASAVPSGWLRSLPFGDENELRAVEEILQQTAEERTRDERLAEQERRQGKLFTENHGGCP